MATGVLGKGTQVKRATTSGGVYTAVPNVGSISGPNSTADHIDVTNQGSSSKIRQFITGLVEPGTLSFPCN